VKLGSKKIPLRFQLTFGQLVVTLAVLFTSASGFLLNDYYLAHKSMKQVVNSTASVISQNLITPLTFQDEKEAKKTLDSLRGHPIFDGARVLDKSGNIFAEFSQGTFNLARAGNGFRFKISYENEQLGELIFFPKQDYSPESWFGYVTVLVAVLLFGTLLSWWLSHMTTRSLVKQVDKLLSVARQIRVSGDFTARAAAGQIATREISKLAQEFNDMVSVVESRNNHIKEMNANLEKTVEERTRELVEAQASLVHSGRMSALGEMSAGIAHEINNPLAMIAGKARKLRRLVDAPEFNTGEALESLNVIDNTVQRITKVIKGLKGFTRDGDADPFELCGVRAIVLETLEFCASRFQAQGVELRVPEIPEEWKVSVRSTQISQVILNLLNNAFDAVSAESDPRWVELSITKEDNRYLMFVTDSGPGIPDHVREKIMRPFFTTKEAGAGTGLGLSISRKIMEAHGGSLTLDPNPKPTKFIVCLPITQA
jgi:C4-dicarboxylate-specific signal transduction histidine kinase